MIYVLGTKFMIVYSEKMLTLALPAMIIILVGLLVIQTTKKYGKRFELLTVLAISAVFSLHGTILLNFFFRSFPATVMVICGWLTTLGARHLYKSLVPDAIRQKACGRDGCEIYF